MAHLLQSLTAQPHSQASAWAGNTGWLSRWLGQDIVADDRVTLGTSFSDQIIVGSEAKAVFAGAGADVLIAANPGSGLNLWGGGGDDLFVLGPSDAPVRVVFDASTAQTGSGDQIVLTGFGTDSVIKDLGGGMFEVTDPDGDVVTINVASPAGTIVDADTVANSLVFSQGGITEIGGTQGAPRVVIANDVPGAELRDRAGATTFVVDETVQSVRAGGGDDVLQITFDAAPDGTGGADFGYRGGAGDDVVVFESAVVDFALTGDDNFVIAGGAGNDRLSIELGAENLGRMDILGGAGADQITIDLRGSTGGIVTVNGGAGDDTFVFYTDEDPAGPNVLSLDVTTVANQGNDTLIVLTGSPQTTAGTEKCYFESDGTDGALLTLVLPDFGETVEVFTDAEGAVIFRDLDTGATFGCYFCDDGQDLSARELLQSDGFAADFDTILIG